MLLTLVTDKDCHGELFLSNNNIVDGDASDNNPAKYTMIDNSSSVLRPIKCSELYNKLRVKSWGNFCIKYISTARIDNPNSDDIDNFDPYEEFTVRATVRNPIESGIFSDIPTILTSNIKDRVNDDEICSSGFRVTGNSFSAEDMDAINDKFAELFGLQNEVNDTYFFRSTKSLLDLSNSSVTFNLFNNDTGIYINSLNFSGLINHAVTSKISAVCTITVCYSDKSGMLVERDFSFKIFEYKKENSEIKLETENFISKILNDVQIEYFNNELRVLPLKDTITECIIENCTITYGNLQTYNNKFN